MRTLLRDRPRLLLVLTLLIVLGSAVSVWLALTRPSEPAPATAPALDAQGRYVPADFAGPPGAALDEAATGVPLALSYDYRDLAGSRRAATAHMTTAFAQRYLARFRRASAPFVSRKEVVDAQVVAAGIVRAPGSGEVICLLDVDQRLLRSRASSGSVSPTVISRARVRAVMRLVDGSWRIADLSPV